MMCHVSYTAINYVECEITSGDVAIQLEEYVAC